MTLYQTIEAEMKSALKEGNAIKLSVLRMLISAVRKTQMDKGTASIEDTDVVQAISRQIKQHKESIAQFTSGNRQDLADKEATELKILDAYMPEQLSDEALADIIKSAIVETGAATKAEMGKVMKIVTEKTKGRCDGKIVSQMVMKSLK